jgi:hypothetical protein
MSGFRFLPAAGAARARERPRHRILPCALACAAALFAQQDRDTVYKPPAQEPSYRQDGPLVLIDEGHYNFHTAGGRFQTFADLLRGDGYTVKPLAGQFSPQSFQAARVLVISNALSKQNANHWELPTPSAFTDEEIGAVVAWVRGGGRLLLIADHMPFPGCADKLAGALGVRFINAFVSQSRPHEPPDVFSRVDGSLADHAISNGRRARERIESIATFGGSAFQAADAAPLLVLGPSFVAATPKSRADMNASTPRMPVEGWLQGAALTVGQGRVAVFGEAGMFTAQLSGPQRTPMGMNHPKAARNYQFVLNVMHWLSGLLG